MKFCFSVAFILCTAFVVAQPKKICVMGSSTAYGHFIMNGVPLYPRDSAWTFKIKKHYKDAGIIDTLYNISASGNGPYHGMPSSYIPPPGRSFPYFPFNITKAVNFNPRPNVLIVSYPSNQYDYLSKTEIINCLQTIKDSANASGIICYITTSQPRDNFSAAERIKLKEIRDTIMNVFGPWAIDFFTDLADTSDYKIKAEYALGDGVHLNAAGHEVLKQKIISKNIFLTTVPVTLHNFKGHKLDKGSALLSWQTSTEINTDYFIIQRSSDAINYNTIGSKIASGNTAQLKNYQFEDLSPATGNNFYRLITVDKDGQKEFSEKLRLNFIHQQFIVQDIYPNPVQHTINVRITVPKKSFLKISIINNEGKIISTGHVAIDAQFNYQYNSSYLKSGNYLLQIKNEKTTIIKPFIKL